MKMNGTAICVDSDEVAGQTFVKALNDSLGTKEAPIVRAYFYQCDFHEEAEVVQVLNEINKQHKDLSVVINASKYDSLIATYFGVSLTVKRNKKWLLINPFYIHRFSTTC